MYFVNFANVKQITTQLKRPEKSHISKIEKAGDPEEDPGLEEE